MMLAAVTITSALLLVIDGTAIDRVLHWMGDAVDGGSFASILVMARLGTAEVWAPVWIIASAGVIAAVARLAVHGAAEPDSTRPSPPASSSAAACCWPPG